MWPSLKEALTLNLTPEGLLETKAECSGLSEQPGMVSTPDLAQAKSLAFVRLARSLERKRRQRLWCRQANPETHESPRKFGMPPYIRVNHEGTFQPGPVWDQGTYSCGGAGRLGETLQACSPAQSCPPPSKERLPRHNCLKGLNKNPLKSTR